MKEKGPKELTKSQRDEIEAHKKSERQGLSGGGVTRKMGHPGVEGVQTRPSKEDLGDTKTVTKGGISMTINAPKGYLKKGK